MASRSKQDRVEHFARVCREHGLPMTTQRQAVFEMLLDREDHPTADDLYEQVQNRIPSISRTTVYRILEHLVEFRLITKICHPGSAARFEPKNHRHDHLVCVHCERIIDIEDPNLDAIPRPDVSGHGFEIHDHHIHFRGVCADCQKAVPTRRHVSNRTTSPSMTAARRRLKQRSSTRQRRSRT